MNERQYIGKVTLAVKLKRALWNVVRVMLFRPFVTKVFRLWRVAVLRVFGAKVSWKAEVYASAKVWAPWNLEMEAGSCLGPDSICYNQAMVRLEQDVVVSQYAYICTAGHGTRGVHDNDTLRYDTAGGLRYGQEAYENELPLNNAKSGLVVAPVTLHRGAWVGTRAYINMGVEVGENAIVGACACVFKDVEAESVVGGNPARKIKDLHEGSSSTKG